jgi:hypothetical protein
MAEYFFDRGKFGMYNTPAWAGQTRALKLIKLLRKQGYSGIVYEEGPLEDYCQEDLIRPLQNKYLDTRHYRDTEKLNQIVADGLCSKSPEYYKVIFKEVQ